MARVAGCGLGVCLEVPCSESLEAQFLAPGLRGGGGAPGFLPLQGTLRVGASSRAPPPPQQTQMSRLLKGAPRRLHSEENKRQTRCSAVRGPHGDGPWPRQDPAQALTTGEAVWKSPLEANVDSAPPPCPGAGSVTGPILRILAEGKHFWDWR